MIPILLLKTKSTPTDGYEEHFSRAGNYQPSFIPVLEHKFREDALDKIHDLIKSKSLVAPHEPRLPGQYGGIIFTSQRAVEALSIVVDKLRKASLPLSPILSHNIPFYVVGPATARGLSALDLDCPIIGEETGNGEALALFILKDYNARWKDTSSTKPALLFLVGEQRRDIIPRSLQSDSLDQSQRIGVDELIVYETGEMQSFRADFTAQWSRNIQQKHDVQWIVVFSPTGCEAMLESLGFLDPDTSKVKSTKLNKSGSKIFVATIGPTTRDYLRREFDFEPDVCAQTPSPGGVLEAISTFMAQSSQGES